MKDYQYAVKRIKELAAQNNKLSIHFDTINGEYFLRIIYVDGIYSEKLTEELNYLSNIDILVMLNNDFNRHIVDSGKVFTNIYSKNKCVTFSLIFEKSGEIDV